MTTTIGHTNGVDKRVQVMHQVDELRANHWRLALPGDNWVKFRDPETVQESQRRAFREATALPGVYAERIEAALASGNLTAVDMLAERQAAAAARADYVGMALVIESWSFDVPLPTVREPDSINQLEGRYVNPMYRVAELLVNAAFFDGSPSTEEHSPFVASSG